MGCIAIDAPQPSRTIYSSKSPIVSNLSQPSKQTLSALIQRDDILNLAVAMSQHNALPNSQISDQRMKWMLTHLCCRWDADNCLQYLLKSYFCSHPIQYIDFVNSPTSEGYTCLHLCAMWKSEKCFYVLHYYGGLNLNAREKMYKTPYESAGEYKCNKMREVLQTYVDLGINFTTVETMKLISGDVIAEDIGSQMKKKEKQAEKLKNSQKQIANNQSNSLLNNLSQMQKNLLQQKKKLQKQKQQLLQSKLKQQLQAQAQKKKMVLEQSQKKVQQQRLEYEKKMKQQIDQQLKIQQQTLLSNIKQKQDELNRVKDDLRRQQQQRIKKQKQQAQRKAEQFIKLQQEEINKKLREKEETLNKLKKQEEERAKKEKEEAEKRLKKVQEDYAKKQQEIQRKLKEKEQQVQRMKKQEQQRIAKQKQSAQKMSQQASKKAQEEYNRQLKQKEQEFKRIKQQQTERLRKQKQQAEKKALQLAKEQTKKANDQINQAKKKQQQLQNAAKQVSQGTSKTLHQLQQSYKSLNQQLPAQIQQMYTTAIQTNTFTDAQFPPQNSSIGDPSKSNFSNFTSNTIWLRPKQIFKSDNFKLFDGIDPNDIKQGSLGVCYMLATLSVLAENPKNVEKIFVFADTRVGFYVLRFWVNGKIKFIVVDDFIPCNKTTKSPLFTKPIGNQIWVLLVEKAWAKIIGDYLSAQAMTPDHMMEDLSAAPGFGSWFEKDASKSNAQHIKTLLKNDKLGHVIVVTSGDKKIQGIANNHAYSVLGVYQYNGRIIFKVRNPWGQFEWNGQYGQNSSLWTQELKKLVGFAAKDDGIFHLSENQLTQAYVYYSISLIDEKSVYSYTEFTSRKFEDIFYRIKITKPGNVNFRITQVFDRMLRDKSYKYSPMVFEVGKISPDKNSVKFLSQGSQKSYFGAKSVHAFETITQNLQAGQYFIRIRMLWTNPQKYNTAVFAAYGPQAVSFEKLGQQQGLKYMKALFVSFASNQARNPIGNNDGFYKIATMKGQFVFIGQTEKEGKQKMTFKFTKSKMQMAQIDLGKAGEAEMEFLVSKGQPGVGSAMRTQPSKGGTTGPVNILIQKA